LKRKITKTIEEFDDAGNLVTKTTETIDEEETIEDVEYECHANCVPDIGPFIEILNDYMCNKPKKRKK